MTEIFQEFLIQAGAYLTVIIIAVGIFAVFFKGIFGSYVKVRASFGRLVLIKLKAINTDHFTWGKIDGDGFLVWGKKYQEKRVKILDSSDFYSLLGVKCIDIDEETNWVIKPTGDKVDGFDAQKYENLYVRALYKPNIQEGMEKIMIGIAVLTIILIVVCIFMVYKQGVTIQGLTSAIHQLQQVQQQSVNVIGGGSTI